MLKFIVFSSLCGLASVQAQTVSLGGRVFSTGGNAISGAAISLISRQSSTTSDAGGNFSFSSTAILPDRISSGYSFELLRGGISISLARRVVSGHVELYGWNGKKEVSIPLDGMEKGVHNLAIPNLSPGFYMVRLSLDGNTYAHRLLRMEGGFLNAGSREVSAARSGAGPFAKTAVAIDTLLAVKAGFQDTKVPVGSLTKTNVQIVMTPVCTIPAMPAAASLPSIAKLPDPFMSMSGSRVGTKAAWDCRREEISRQFQAYELGTMPPRPASVTASLSGNSLTISVTDGGKTISFAVTITKPTTGTAPYPVLIGYGSSSLSDVISLGVATLNYPNNTIANDGAGTSTDRGKGLFYTLYGSTHSAGSLMAWAWGVSRIIDALELTPEAGLDPSRVAVTGCSRNGKGALVAGAFDPRIALTFPQESGSGGTDSWRVSDYMLDTLKQSTQTLTELVTEEPWLSTVVNPFLSGKTRLLPFDHHMLVGMVAPRALVDFSNSDYLWLGALSSFTNDSAAKRIYIALGAPEAMTYSEVGGHAHCSFPTGQKHWVDSYVRKYLLGGTGEAAKIENDQHFMFDENRWVNWTTPTLQ